MFFFYFKKGKCGLSIMSYATGNIFFHVKILHDQLEIFFSIKKKFDTNLFRVFDPNQKNFDTSLNQILQYFVVQLQPDKTTISGTFTNVLEGS